MAYCTFFGHRRVPAEIRPLLKDTVAKLIKSGKADTFYVGNNGMFDAMVRGVLKELSLEYPHIKYYVMLAYMPKNKNNGYDYSDTIYPEGLENTPYKYAIPKRNRIMIDNSDYVITYVTNTFSNASTYMKMAKKKKKHVINIADI